MKIENLGKDLDIKAMTAVIGGDNGNSAINTVGQVMNIGVPVSILSAGPANNSIHVSGTQNAQIGTYQNAGDAFLALFPTAFAL